MELSLEQQTRLTRIEGAMKQAELYAQYWIAMATTGAAAKRSIIRGNNVPFTDDEKIADALSTALQHIDRLGTLANNKALVLENRLNELQV